jgi:hypothetical protein
MKVIVFILMAVMVGYTSGLMAESMVEGEYSKINTLATTGEFNERWIPFNLSPKINEFVATYGVLSASMGFLENAEMAELPTTAEIDFVISTEKRTSVIDGEYLVNRISECIFEADELIFTSCIICLLKDDTGTNIAKGQTDVGTEYDPDVDGSISIPMTEFLELMPPMEFEEDITDVRNVHAVELGICIDGNEGCSAKFWKDNKKQWPPSLDQKDKFKQVFGIQSEIKIGKHTDPTLTDALKAKGKTDIEFLAREATAALLNAVHTAVPYPLSSDFIIQSTQIEIDSDPRDEAKILALAENFANLNEKGCLLEKCKCEAVTRLLLEYTGPDDVTITVKDKDIIIETFLHVDSGDTIEVFPPAGQDKFKANTIFEISDNNGLDETIAIHTSCSRAIAVDQVHSDVDTSLTIKELDQTFKSEKGEVCPLAPLKCKGVEGMELKYFGAITPVTITVHEKADEPPFDTITGIITGGTFDVEPSNTKFKANTIFKILDEDNNDTQFELATKHTSCSKPIAVGDLIGFSLEITALELVLE